VSERSGGKHRSAQSFLFAGLCNKKFGRVTQELWCSE